MFGERTLRGPLRRASILIAALAVLALLAASPAAAAGPTVTINQAAGQPDPTAGPTIEFTATFSAPVTGFTATDVSLAGTTAGGGLVVNVAGGPTTYSVTISGMTSGGNVVASIPAGAAQDSGSNPSAASTSTDHAVTWNEPVPPSVTIDQASDQPDPSAAPTVRFTATFSKPVHGFDGADVNIGASTTAGTLEANVTGGPTVYRVNVSGMTGPGVVIASIPALAAEDEEGRPSLASTSTDGAVSWFVDQVPPTVTIDAAAGQSDPTSASPVLFTARFSEPVTDFSAADVLLTGSTAGGPLSVAVEGGPTIYTVAVSGMSSAGTVVATLPAGAALDLGENPSAASTSTHNSVSWVPPAAPDSSGGSGAQQSAAPGPVALPSVATLRLLTSCRAKHPCPTSRSGKALPLRVACGAAAPCTGTVAIVLGHRTLGTLRLHLAAGATTTLRVPLHRSAARLLAARRRFSAKLDFTLAAATTTTPITLALPPAHRDR